MKKITVILLILSTLIISACDLSKGPVVPDEKPSSSQPDEDLIIPVLFKGSSSRTIIMPEVDSQEDSLKAGFLQFSPALTGFQANVDYKIGDKIESSYMGVPVIIETSRDCDNIIYEITDNNNYLHIYMMLNTVTSVLEYKQAVCMYVPKTYNNLNGPERYNVVYIDARNVKINEDYSVHYSYDLVFYCKELNNTIRIWKSDKMEFYSSGNVFGFALNNGTKTYNGADFRPKDEIPYIEISEIIKNGCLDKIKESGIDSPQFNAMWYENGVFKYAGATAGHQTLEQMIDVLPWSTYLK